MGATRLRLLLTIDIAIIIDLYIIWYYDIVIDRGALIRL
jgi:hypothetical protein